MMMKRAQFERPGAVSEVLQMVNVPLPEPGPGEVRIRITFANINPSDLAFIAGQYGIRPQYPSGAGFEATGTIDACGEGVDLPVGKRVIFTTVGVWQEYAVVKAASLLPAPDAMSDKVACQAFVNPYTAYGMLKASGLKKGQWLMLTAGGSAFAKFVIQLANAQGINTLATVRREEQIAELKAFGATEVVNTQSENWPKIARGMTGQKGVDYIFDAVGGTTASEALECLLRGGTMLVFGMLSLRPIPLNSGLLIFKNLTVKGFWLSTWFPGLSREEMKAVSQEVLGLLTRQELAVNVEAVYGLDEVVEAVEHSERPGRGGKILLKIGE